MFKKFIISNLKVKKYLCKFSVRKKGKKYHGGKTKTSSRALLRSIRKSPKNLPGCP